MSNVRRSVSFGESNQGGQNFPEETIQENAPPLTEDPTMATKLFSIRRLSARFSRQSIQQDKPADSPQKGSFRFMKRSMSFSGSSGMAAALSSTGNTVRNIISPPRPEAAPVTTLDLAAHHLFSAGLNLFKGLTSSGGGNAFISFGEAHTIGRRGYMEDRFIAEVNFGTASESKQSIFGVFDGHGGELAAQYCTDNIPVHIRSSKVLQTDPALALKQAFERTDQDFCTLASNEFLDDGSTAVVAYIKDNVVWCANAGDSRCILSRGAIAIPLSDDHKPNRPDERQRISDCGGFVKFLGVWRTQGILAVSRAIGDLSLKRFVIPTPEIIRLELTDKDEFIVLASDGVWDAMSNQEVVDMLHSRPNLMFKPELAARAIVTESFRRGSFDNITAVVVFLKPASPEPVQEPEPSKASSRRRKSTKFESISEGPEFVVPESMKKNQAKGDFVVGGVNGFKLGSTVNTNDSGTPDTEAQPNDAEAATCTADSTVQ